MEHAPSWLINSFIYLSAAVIAVPLSKALGLGAIIGYLAAGMAIGPWGLGLVTNVQDILHFAEFGVVLMLFLVGLELEPKRLWSMRRPIFGWGSAQVVTCALVLTGLAMAFGVTWQVALVASLGLALSSTAIALQVMADRSLITDIEPFKGLLLGLFFIAVGMSIDFGVLFDSPGLMAAIVLGFLVFKCLVIYTLATLMRLPLQDRPVFALLLAQGGEFAFVVFQAAAGARVFDAQTASLLIGAVTVSMLVSPLLLVAVDKWLLPRLARRRRVTLEEIAEQQDAPVLIAGFGRYGQIVARMMLAEGFPCTVLDHDSEMVEAARSFGYKVFYGDASRLDLLRTAGANTAKVLVVAVNDVAQSLSIVDLVQAHFPNLKIVARARDVTHWSQLRDRGVTLVQRELFESSLRSGRSVLELLGNSPHDANVTARRFRSHNLELFEKMYPHYKDRAKMIAVGKQGRLQLQAQMAEERLERAKRKAAEQLAEQQAAQDI